MSENTYAELLLPGESKKRETREILSFKPRNMKPKCESPSSSSLGDGLGRSPKLLRTLSESSEVFPPLSLKTEEQKTTTVRFEDSVVECKEETKGGVTALKALETISLHLTNNKKFTKALRLMIQLIESSMDETNSDIFFTHLSDLMRNCPPDRDITVPPYSQGYSDLISLYYSKKALLSDEKNCYKLETYYILVCLRANLATDDSYTFNKACNELKALIILMCNSSSSSSSSNSSSSESSSGSGVVDSELSSNDHSTNGATEASIEAQAKAAVVKRESAVLVCLDTAFRIYHWTWAKQPCDALYACAAERRLLFTDESRDGLDTLNMAITAAQRKDTSWSGPHTIRTHNSTAHPLLSKNVGLLR